MIRDVAADLSGVLPSSVAVVVRHGAIFLRHDGRVLRLTATAGDALLRRLPTLPGRASLDVIEDAMGPPVWRMRRALRRLRRPTPRGPIARRAG